ncbi:hypothetical protein DPMN_176632 [Dreissena polymorpha]|uniref:Tyrosinase copper-binding domain-containing protein n=2 Tax=Dreissena polymorpha TaxID=45954 RepID=A0A9D4EBP5_DREPO|nr:hypothetical protein DPMN_176632 [Dreissena polymorpha]
MEDSMAAADPVFYMHHAFVDYVWEKFRQRQRAVCGVDPASDYPPVDPALPEHGPDRNMTGMTFLTNREGIADYWIANWFNYTDTPTCPSCGNSPDLYCDTDINRCVSASNFSFGEATIGPTAQGLGLAPPPGTAPQRATARPVSPASTTPKAATYADSVKTGGKPYEGSCSKDPYARSCVKRPQPSTPAELVNAMSLNKVPKPKPLDDVYERIKALLKKGERYPPGSEAKFFKMKPDEENDCRCLDKYIRDPLVAYVEKGRKLSKSGPKLYDTYT